MTTSGEKLTKRAISIENQLLMGLCSYVKKVEFGDYEVEFLDLHIHPAGIGSSLVEHEHSFIEIHVIDQGAGVVSVGKKNHGFKEGQFTINLPGQVHFWQVSKRPLVMHVWWIKVGEVAGEVSDDAAKLFANMLLADSAVYKLPEGFDFLYGRMIEELSKQQLCYEVAARDYLSQLLILFARAVTKKRSIRSKKSLPSAEEEDRIVSVVNRFLKDNLATSLVLEDVARHATMSRRNLTRYYRRATGRSVGDKLNDLRMLHAEELLRETDMPIKAIAYSCGVPDIRYFARKFKTFFDCTPSEFRKKMVESPGRKMTQLDSCVVD